MPLFASDQGLPAWVQIVFGGGIAALILPMATKKLDQLRTARKLRKDAPLQAADSEIAEMRTDVDALKLDNAKVNAWLLGGRDPFTGELVGNGFKDDYPAFKREVKDGFANLEQLIKRNGNGVAH